MLEDIDEHDYRALAEAVLQPLLDALVPRVHDWRALHCCSDNRVHCNLLVDALNSLSSARHLEVLDFQPNSSITRSPIDMQPLFPAGANALQRVDLVLYDVTWLD